MSRFFKYLIERLINFSGTAFSNSKKTMVTVDFTTNCPKRRAGNPCPYCLTGDSKILMSDFSQKKIKDIKIGDKIAGFDENGKIKLQESTVLNLSKKRKSKVYNVKLENGYEIKITDNHPIRASHPEKGLKWLTIDDFKSGKYDDFKVKFINPNLFKISSNMNSDDYKIGYLISSILGDGFFSIEKNHSYRMRFVVKDTELFNYVKDLFDYFEIKYYIDEFKFEIGNRNLDCIFANYKESYYKVLQMIELYMGKSESKEYMAGFLAGAFDCEGNFNSARYHQSLKYEKGKKYIDEVKRCLNYFDFSWVEEERGNQVISVRIKKEDDSFIKMINLIETKIPRKSLIAFMGHGKDIIGGSKIASIEECDEEYVYNFESTSGTYIANGILVHNCYVEVARRIKERKPKFYLAKKVYDYRAYNHELIKRKVFKNPETIKMINDSGGLRLFSFGDYMPEHDNDIKGLLDDAAKIGLDVKAITKVPEFVYKFHDYPALKEINISIDFIGHGIEHKTALELQKKYKKVSIRAVVLNDKELEDDFMEYVDIITFNHEKLGDVDIGKSIKNYSKKEIQKFFKDNPKYGVCCITGRCATCPIKCGKRKYSQDCLML